jgi:hypothetical protein
MATLSKQCFGRHAKMFCMITGVYIAGTSNFAGLGKAGLITVIVVSIILIVTFVWLFRGTKKRD